MARAARALPPVVALGILVGTVPDAPARAGSADHLVISELVTGGVGASDEFIELLNPAPTALSLVGLEVAYVSASGVTVTQRAAWSVGAPLLAPGSHLLLANEAGIHAAAADVHYAGGLATTGGTIVLRVADTNVAIDAVGWGTAAGPWVEGSPAPAPAAGASIERILSPLDGEVQDTDDNAADFVERLIPTPQNFGGSGAAAPPATPSATAAATETGIPAPTPAASPVPQPVPIAAARGAPNGTTVTVDGTALTGSTFQDGGGYVADETGGIAVLLEGEAFTAGARLIVTGTLEDRFAQRTIRARSAVTRLPVAAPVVAVTASTGGLGESLEGRLVRLSGTIRGTATALTSGLAFDVDDGSGVARVLVGLATGIETVTWTSGAAIEVVGVVGQRDSSGTGTSGYRILPRSPSDVARVTPSHAPSPTGSAIPTAAPGATALPMTVVTIAAARAASTGTHLAVRGVVTMPAGIVDATTAVIQDASGAIVIRVDDSEAPLRVGDIVEVRGVRSTRAGMETLRASAEAIVLDGLGDTLPAPVRHPTAWEELEARLVVVAGRLVSSARRASSGTLSFEIVGDAGVIRVVMPAALGADDTDLTAGVAVEVVGIVGQETTGAEPSAGYRIWPRTSAEVRIVGTVADDSPPPAMPSPVAGGAGASDARGDGAMAAGEFGSLEGLDAASGALHIGATLVAGNWPELAIAGLLWDGERLVAISRVPAGTRGALARLRPPVPIAARGLLVVGVEPRSGIPLVALGASPADIGRAPGAPAEPAGSLPARGEPAKWVTLVGRVANAAVGPRLTMGDLSVRLEVACEDRVVLSGVMSVTGIGVGEPARMIVPCDAVRPAPTLTLEAPAVPKVARHAEKGSTASPMAGEPRRTLAAWLLVLAAGMVVGSAAVARRQWSITNVGDARGSDSQQGVGDVPPLTLVRLQRDEGS